VLYSSPIKDYRHHRFMDYKSQPSAPFDKTQNDYPFNNDQRDFWEAIAIYKSGTSPEKADWPNGIGLRSGAAQNFIINLALGLNASSRSNIPVPTKSPWTVNIGEQLAGYIASHYKTDSVKSNDPQRTHDLLEKSNLTRVWQNWESMEDGSPSWKTNSLYLNGRLKRCTAGRRDFDINIDDRFKIDIDNVFCRKPF